MLQTLTLDLLQQLDRAQYKYLLPETVYIDQKEGLISITFIPSQEKLYKEFAKPFTERAYYETNDITSLSSFISESKALVKLPEGFKDALKKV